MTAELRVTLGPPFLARFTGVSYWVDRVDADCSNPINPPNS